MLSPRILGRRSQSLRAWFYIINNLKGSSTNADIVIRILLLEIVFRFYILISPINDKKKVVQFQYIFMA